MTAIFDQIKKPSPLFIITVLIPTIAAILYFGLIASDVYVSESRFVVRSSEKQVSSGLGALLKGASISGSSDDAFAVQDYVESRDALRALNADNAMVTAYSRPGVDPINRFDSAGFGRSFEDLYKYFKSMLKVEHDSGTAITTLSVRAYTAQDAYRINRKLLEQSEALVNQLNLRARADMVRFAASEVKNAKLQATRTGLALAAYRNRASLIDPERQAPSELQGVMLLRQQVALTRTQLAQMRAYAPSNPQIRLLQTRLSSLEREYQMALGRVAGSDGSLAGATAQYQKVELENQFAQRQLAAALTSLAEAQNEARRKQIYLERIVEPNLPDEAIEPRRWRGILATLALGLVACGILSMLLAGFREHQD